MRDLLVRAHKLIDNVDKTILLMYITPETALTAVWLGPVFEDKNFRKSCIHRGCNSICRQHNQTHTHKLKTSLSDQRNH